MPIAAQDSVYTLQPIEITAERSLNNFQTSQILEKSDIQTFNLKISLEEIFLNVPGTVISDRNNPSLGDKISIRGIGSRASFGTRGIKIFLDDIPLTLPDGQSQTNNIDIFTTDRVKILKGPASLYYGNAAGGVINFRSELPDNESFNITPEVILGSYNLRRYSLKFSGHKEPHSFLLSLNNISYKGFREHSDRKTYQLNAVYKNELSDKINLKGIINYFNSPYLLNPGSLDRESLVRDRNTVREFNILQGTGEKAEQFQSGITINFYQNELSLKTTLFFVKRDLINPIPGRIIELDRKVLGLRSFLNNKFFVNNYEIGVSGGIDIEFQNDLRTEYENGGLPHTVFSPDEIFSNLVYGNKLIDQKENVFGAGPFLSLKLIVNKNLGLLAGVRYDHYFFRVNDYYSNNSGKRIMNQLSPFAGLFFKPDINSKLYFNYTTAFLTPTTSELSNKPDNTGGFNQLLSPEKIYQIESGIEYIISDFNTSLSSAFYYINFNDLIIPYQIQATEEVFFRNAGRAENKGAEIYIENNTLDQVRFILSYSVMDFIFKDYLIEFNNKIFQLRGNKVPGIPQQIIYFQVLYTDERGFEGNVKLNMVDEYFVNDFNGPLPGNKSEPENYLNESFIKIDLNLAYKFSFSLFDTKFFFGINNLFGTNYNGSVVQNAFGERYFEPAPGRNWFAGLNISYNGIN